MMTIEVSTDMKDYRCRALKGSTERIEDIEPTYDRSVRLVTMILLCTGSLHSLFPFKILIISAAMVRTVQ